MITINQQKNEFWKIFQLMVQIKWEENSSLQNQFSTFSLKDKASACEGGDVIELRNSKDSKIWWIIMVALLPHTLTLFLLALIQMVGRWKIMVSVQALMSMTS